MDQKPIRINYVVNARLPGGGVGNVAYRAALALQQRGYLQHLIVNSLRDASFAQSHVSAIGLPGRAIKRLAIYDPTNLVHTLDSLLFDHFAATHLSDCNLVAVWYGGSYLTMHKGKQLGAVTVLQSGSTHPLTQKQLLVEEHRRWGIDYHYPLSRHGLDEIAEADYVIVPAELARDSFIKHGKPADRVILLPWGVDTGRLTPRIGNRQDSIFRVIYVGQVSIRKGIIDVLDAWQKLHWPEAELLIIGRADPITQKVLKFRPLPDRTRWLIHSSELWKWYHESDVFIFPSIEEGSALVTYEALACGLPVITTPNAGSIVRDGEDGFVVPIRDVSALCARLEQLRRDQALRIRMGQSARRWVEQFTWRTYSARLLDAYTRIADIAERS